MGACLPRPARTGGVRDDMAYGQNEAVHRAARARAPTMDGIPQFYGVSVSVLRRIKNRARAVSRQPGPPRSRGARRRAGEPLTVEDVVREIVRPATKGHSAGPYYEVLLGSEATKDVGPANVMVCLSWASRFDDVVSAIESSAAAEPAARYWLEPLCADFGQGRAPPPPPDAEAMRGVGRALLIWAPQDEPLALRRAWVAKALHATVEAGASLVVGLPRGQLSSFDDLLAADFDAVAERTAAVIATAAENAATSAREAAIVREAVVSALHDWLAARGEHRLHAEESRGDRVAPLDLRSQLGMHMRSLGRYSEAEPLLRDELELCVTAYGELDRRTLAAVNNVATLMHEGGELEEAEALYRRALRGYEQALGKVHEDTLVTVANLAALLHDMVQAALDGDEVAPADALRAGDEAEKLYRRAVRGRTKALGPAHDATQSTAAELDRLRADLDRLAAGRHTDRSYESA